jgi:hypothetical protein
MQSIIARPIWLPPGRPITRILGARLQGLLAK